MKYPRRRDFTGNSAYQEALRQWKKWDKERLEKIRAKYGLAGR